jgi:hypothetical protein
MNLIHTATTKTETGLFIVKILIGNRNYEYQLQSEFAVRKFEYLYRKGAYGKALQVLTKFNLKGKTNGQRKNQKGSGNDELNLGLHWG